ncbi:MAG: NADP-dependent oxidoreductase [Steroidobacteraceae bacterium]
MQSRINKSVTVALGLTSVLAMHSPWAAPATMQAVVASKGNISVQTQPVPEPAAGQVRIKVYSVGVNPVDYKTVERRATAADFIPGYDSAGVVDALGSGVTGLKVGDAVMGWTRNLGTYAEYVVIPAETAIPKAANVSFADASAIPHAGYTAWNLAVVIGEVASGKKVLILGGSGGVGAFAIQIAKNKGAYVIATASTRNQEFMKSLGADEVIDYTKEKFEDKLKNINVVINTVDVDNANGAVKVLKKGGILASVGGLPEGTACADAGVRCENRNQSGTTAHDAMTQMMQWAGEGKFKVNIESNLCRLDGDQ